MRKRCTADGNVLEERSACSWTRLLLSKQRNHKTALASEFSAPVLLGNKGPLVQTLTDSENGREAGFCRQGPPTWSRLADTIGNVIAMLQRQDSCFCMGS